MAKRLKDLEGWKILKFDENNNLIDEDRRRSRRQNQKISIYLEREEDKLRITRGDSVIMKKPNEDGERIYVIHELRLNTTNNVLELIGLNYLQWKDLEPKNYFEFFEPALLNDEHDDTFYQDKLTDTTNKQELYLTAQLSEIWLKNFQSTANVISQETWKSDGADLVGNNNYVVNYLCDPDSTNFVGIEFTKLMDKLVKMESNAAEEYLKRISNPKAKSNKTTTSAKKPTVKRARASNLKKIVPSTEDIKLESDEDDINMNSDAEKNDPTDSSYDSENQSNEEMNNAQSSNDKHSDSESSMEESDDDSGYGKRIKRKRGRKPGSKVTTKRKTTPSSLLSSSPSKSSSAAPGGVLIRKYTKRNIARAKKKYTPFSKRYKSIKDIPDLTKLAEFNQASLDLETAAFEKKLDAPKDYKVVETIFSKVKKQLYSSHGRDTIIKASNFSEYLPARENEFASIYLSLYSAIESGSATTVYVAGTPGVGKTLTVREVVKELQNSVKQDELPWFQYVEINGLKMVKPTDGYEVLWNKISGEQLTWAAAMKSLEFYFDKVPKEKKRPVVVLLDELDALVTKQEDIMYNFFNWTTYENAHLIIIAVANTMDLPERHLGTKVSSRIGFTRIMFTGYTYEQLKDIIYCRLKGLNNSYFYVNSENGTAYMIDPDDEKSDQNEQDMPKNIKKVRLRMSDDAIEIAARKVASVSGDARRALKVCKRAAEIAEMYYMEDHGYGYDGVAVTEELNVDNDEDVVKMRKDKTTTPDNPQQDTDTDTVQTVQIAHIMKALNETMNSHNIKFISHLSFTAKLFLYSLLNLINRSSSQEQTFDDIIDEIKHLIQVNSNNKYISQLAKTLFHTENETVPPQARIVSWDYVINQLVEAGILMKQSMKAERRSTVKLCLSIEDIGKALKLDETLRAL